jgi:multimeric flavodoxin WrbA
VSQKQARGRHTARRSSISRLRRSMISKWADRIAFATRARFGNVVAQLKMFLDEAAELWEPGKLVNKVATGFSSSRTALGGQEWVIRRPCSVGGSAAPARWTPRYSSTTSMTS